MSTLTSDQIKTLEQSRQRLVQLTRSLGSLIGSLKQGDPLPSWTSLQSQASIISSNLLSISEHLSENNELLSSLVAYPGPEYPGRTQSSTLEQLLRTKLDPRVEDWVARGRKAGASALEDTSALSETELAALWEWAPVAANEEARRRNWGGNFTLEERERGISVVLGELGLRRVLEDDDDDEEDEDENEDEDGEEQGLQDEMEIVGVRRAGSGVGLEFDIASHTHGADESGSGGAGAAPGLGQGQGQEKVAIVAPVVPLGEILRYMTTGSAPGQR